MTALFLNLKKVLAIKNKLNFSSACVKVAHVWNCDKVVKSPHKDVLVLETTLVEYVWRGLDKWPTKTAAICGVTNRSYTYEGMYKKSNILASNLRRKLNIIDGDTVGIMSPNIPEYPITAFGVLGAGAIATTFNPIYTAHEVQRQIDQSELKLMIAYSDMVPVVKEALKLAKKDIPIVSINVNQPLAENTISFTELVEDNHADLSILREVNRKPEDVAFLPYSSGTTGLPKGTELTNRNFVVNCEQQDTDLRQYCYTTENNQDSVLTVLPMFHCYGLSILMLHKLANGLRLVTLPKFQPETFTNSLIQYKINLLYVAPPLVLFLGTHPQVTAKHFESLHTITSGAAPLPSADIDKMLSKAEGTEIDFTQGYGMTEASPLVTLNTPGSKKYTDVGQALPNIELRVVDEEMKNLGPGQAGELLIKGPNIMKGYKNNPEANKEVFLEGGWYRSGDIASIDESGNVYITDRLKELIKVKGYQVPPAELENVLKEHPSVFDAAVVGIPDSKTGERPKAFIVQKPGVEVKDQQIIDFVAKRVAPYKKISEVVFVDNIPRNASGKILRRLFK